MKPPYEVGKDGFGWLDIESDDDGWVDAALFRPFPYDLVSLKGEGRVKAGWWTGQAWEGLRIAAEDVVYFWKHVNEGR